MVCLRMTANSSIAWTRALRAISLVAALANNSVAKEYRITADTENQLVAKQVSAGDSFGEIESTKTVSELYAPVAGEVTESNEALAEDPAKVNSDPRGEGWFFKIKIADPSELEGLMDEAAYKTFVEGLG